MNTHLQPIILESRFDQLATTLLPREGASDTVIDAVGRQALAALRGFGPMADEHASAGLGRAASRLGRRLLMLRRAPLALEQGILRLGIEMGRHLDPLDIAATVRSVRDGGAPSTVAGVPSAAPAAGQARLFTQIALVALLARSRAA